MRVEIQLLGGFNVRVDGVTTPSGEWRRRHAAALVKLLALSPRARLHRDRVIDTLWPELTLDEAVPRLHKAAHFARQTLRSRDAVVLRGEVVSLFPEATLDVDVVRFEEAADAALRGDGCVTEPAEAALGRYGGELLPDDLNDPWLDEPRARLQLRLVQLLRCARRWDDLLLLEPTDEEAHIELLRAAVVSGDRVAALQRYGEMERILKEELGIPPSPDAVTLRDRALSVEVSTGPTPSHRNIRALRPRGRPSTPGVRLLERDAELDGLLSLVTRVVREARGAVALVAGEAGSGKSSLAQAFLERLDDGVTGVTGGCDDLLAPRSLGPFRDMAESQPALAAALSGGTSPDEVLPALMRFLASGPTVVVVEDVHWADDATLDAIRYVARRIRGIPAVLVLTAREAEIGPTHPLRQILGLLSGPSIHRVQLPPLTVDAIRTLADDERVDPDEIHRVTRGNPFFVTEILASGGVGVPATVRDAVLARVARLSAEARTLVERLSVVPSRAERWLAEALADGLSDVVLQAERAGVISGGQHHLAFRHELARQAIETSLTGGERLQANRAVVDLLLGHPDVEPSRIVHHAEAAGRVDVLLAYGPTAADEAAAVGGHRQAAETLRVVLGHAGRLDPAVVARLLTRRAYSLYVVNRIEEALGCAESAIEAAEDSQEPLVLADSLMALSRTALFARGATRSREAAGRAVAILEGTGENARLAEALVELARAHSNLDNIGIVAEPSGYAVATAERALELGEQLRRDDICTQALCYLGSSRLALGDRRGCEDLERSIEMAPGDRRIELRVRGYVNAAGSAYRDGRFDDADRYVAAGLRLAADGEFFAGQFRLRLTTAAVAASRGQWDRAIEELRELTSGSVMAGVMVPLARSLLARLLARRGDHEAGEILAAALSDPIANEDSHVAGPLAVAQVELAWLEGAPDGVPAAVTRALDLATRTGHRTAHSELCGYLSRAGYAVPAPTEPLGPWVPALAGRWREAADAWERLGERYERAVELALSGHDRARATGLAILDELGAAATVARVRARDDCG